MMSRFGVRLAVLAILLLSASCQTKRPDPAFETPALDAVLAGPLFFQDITGGSGLEFTFHNGEETANNLAILESLGGGVALIDYDEDGLLDVFLTGGGLYTGSDLKEIAGLPCRLFKNLGKGKFKDVTAEVGLDRLAGDKPWFYNHGVAVADYDRDGWPDLLVTGWGRLALFHNIPVDPKDPAKGRRFQDVTAAAGLDHGITWATSAAFGDLDGDGWPDLYVCQYTNWSFANHPSCNYDGKTPDICPPKNFEGLPHKLYHNTGRGTFVDVSTAAGLVPAGTDCNKGLGVVMVDMDGDGKPDLYVTNDTTAKFLYLNVSTPGKIRLKEVAQISGAALDNQGYANGSMGVDAGDFNETGRPSLWVTNYEHELHGLYRNDVRPGMVSFQYYTVQAGLAEMSQKYVGWGTSFLDVDLDGWEDLFVATGHVIRHHPGKWVGRKQPPVLYRNLGGKFKDASRQIGSYQEQKHVARGVGFGDLDNDGRIDLVISHINEPVTILRGIGGSGRSWLGVELKGKDHGDVVGAKVELQVDKRKLTRFAKGGGSYLSSGDRRLVFGLGEKGTPGRLTVTWPNGEKQFFDGLASNCYHRIRQGQTKAELLPTRK